MKRVFEALNLREAHLRVAFLEAHGIQAEVRGSADHAVRGELISIPGLLPTLWAEDAQAQEAMDLLVGYEAILQSGPTGEPWRCVPCGETHEAQFLSCWKCGTPRPMPAGDGTGL